MKIFKAIACLLVVSTLSVVAYAQATYYKEYGKCRILSAKQLERKKEILQHKYPDATVEFKIVDESIRADSIICTYQAVVKFNPSTTIELSAYSEGVYKLINKPFPEFKLNDINGVSCTFEKLKGKPVVLNFWFNGCTPCKREMSVLNQIKMEYNDRVHFVSITYNTAQEVKDVLKSNPFNFIHLIDAKPLIKQIGVSGYPKTIIIDSKGVVRQIMECVDSEIDESGNVVLGKGDEIRQEIEKVL